MPVAVRAALLLVVALVAASCGEVDPPSSPEAAAPIPPSPDPTAPAAPTPAVSYTGIPYGPYSLYANTTEFEWGPAPFTVSLESSGFPNAIVRRIEAARQQRHRMVLAMTAERQYYITNGKFDLGKWKARMNTLNTAAIKKAVADGVADGTIVGNKLLDEPESPQWGGVPTKALIDQMATYAKSIFPTLPMGVTYGAPGFRWRTGERYKVVDWVGAQYVWNYNQGDIIAWRDAVLSVARADGVTPVFSLNILNGGVRDKVGAWDCPGTGGKGTGSGYCRMTADQVRTYGRAIGPYGCAMLMWRYDDAFMSKSANKSAFQDVASLLNSKPRRSCLRP
jgi:hypothetical protein